MLYTKECVGPEAGGEGGGDIFTIQPSGHRKQACFSIIKHEEQH